MAIFNSYVSHYGRVLMTNVIQYNAHLVGNLIINNPMGPFHQQTVKSSEGMGVASGTCAGAA